jgi:hypothetical protein
MSQSNEELAEELKGLLGQTGLGVAIDTTTEQPAADPLESDFFKAINAFRAARSGGDPQAIAAAEDALREVVRGELAGGA